MRIAIGADHRGVEVMKMLAPGLERQGHEVYVLGPCGTDVNGSCDYPDAAYAVSSAVAERRAEMGILICGTGIGMCIAANKVRGVRAALVHDEIGADLSRRHNDANVLCVSADMLGQRIIERIVAKWLGTAFEGGRHARRVSKITAIEQGLDPGTVSQA